MAQFEKGKSGNPNGRPKVVEAFKAKARKAVDEHVIDAWIGEVEARGREWMKASELLAAYGYGKPAQSLEVSGPDGEPLLGRSVADMTEDELAAEVARLKALREGAGK